jgi:hypothetical protein
MQVILTQGNNNKVFIILVKNISIFVGHNRFREAVHVVDTTG